MTITKLLFICLAISSKKNNLTLNDFYSAKTILYDIVYHRTKNLHVYFINKMSTMTKCYFSQN